jgi:hypothetical protein
MSVGELGGPLERPRWGGGLWDGSAALLVDRSDIFPP